MVAYVILFVGMIITFTGDFFFSKVTMTLLLVPVIAIMQLMFSIGLGLFLSLISLVVRDVQIVIQYIVIALLVVTPIAYTPDMIPSGMLPLLYLNPLFYFVSSYQHLILLNQLPPLDILLLALGSSIFMFTLGLWFFNRTRQVLNDLL